MTADTLTRVKMAGACRSGGDTRGTLVHLVHNPQNRSRALLGPALCGKSPRGDWSGWEPQDGDICPKCQRRAKEKPHDRA